MSGLERFWSKVDKLGSPENPHCWVWTASRHPQGYGQFRLGGRSQPAHRVAYELLVEPVPAGLELDHLCRFPPCCNPAHLEPVTHAENMRRGAQSMKTHCPAGHAYSETNTLIYRGMRRCRQCHRERQLRRYHNRLHDAFDCVLEAYRPDGTPREWPTERQSTGEESK